MALADAIQGARYIAQRIRWVDERNTAISLTGAVLSGKIKSISTGAVISIDGTLTPDPDQITNKGWFDWAYGSGDVSTPGEYLVQFIATVAGQTEKTFQTRWRVQDALDL